MLFQNKLKELRKEKNISQYDLADALNISRSVVAKWENGLTLPSEESIRLLMDYFNVSREELFKNEETESVIAKKNASILKMKKLIIYLSSAMVVLIVTTIIVFTSLTPKSLSKQLYKLGKFEDVKMCFARTGLYSASCLSFSTYQESPLGIPPSMVTAVPSYISCTIRSLSMASINAFLTCGFFKRPFFSPLLLSRLNIR